MSDDGDCCYPIRADHSGDVNNMVPDHAQRLAQAIDNMEKTSVCMDIFDRAVKEARAAGRREAFEEAARHVVQKVSHYDGEELHWPISIFAQCEADWCRAKAKEGA